MIEHLKEFNDLVDAKDTYRPGRGVPEPPDEDGITRCIVDAAVPRFLQKILCRYGA